MPVLGIKENAIEKKYPKIIGNHELYTRAMWL